MNHPWFFLVTHSSANSIMAPASPAMVLRSFLSFCNRSILFPAMTVLPIWVKVRHITFVKWFYAQTEFPCFQRLRTRNTAHLLVSSWLWQPMRHLALFSCLASRSWSRTMPTRSLARVRYSLRWCKCLSMASATRGPWFFWYLSCCRFSFAVPVWRLARRVWCTRLLVTVLCLSRSIFIISTRRRTTRSMPSGSTCSSPELWAFYIWSTALRTKLLFRSTPSVRSCRIWCLLCCVLRCRATRSSQARGIWVASAPLRALSRLAGWSSPAPSSSARPRLLSPLILWTMPLSHSLSLWFAPWAIMRYGAANGSLDRSVSSTARRWFLATTTTVLSCQHRSKKSKQKNRKRGAWVFWFRCNHLSILYL